MALTEYARADVRARWSQSGCYRRLRSLRSLPLLDAGLLLPNADVIIDAKSGVSGAGKTPTEQTHFCEVHGSLSACGVLNHRHGAEIGRASAARHLHAASAAD